MLKENLFRFSKTKKVFDPFKKEEGKGFYICPECLKKKMNILEKITAENAEQLKNKTKREIISLIQLGWKSRLIRIGFEDTERELKKGKKGFLILAKDLSENSKKKIMRKCIENIGKCTYFEFLTKEELGKILGKENVGIIFIPETKLGIKIKNLLNKYQKVFD